MIFYGHGLGFFGTRAVAMVALHADKLPEWRERMQKDLVQDIEQGLTVTAREIAHGEVLRSVLWHRVRAFMAIRDLLILPTVAVPPFPVEQPYPTEINGKPLDSYFQWFYLRYGITLTGLPTISVPCGFTKSGLPVGRARGGRSWPRGPPDRRSPPSGGRRPPRRRRFRGRGTLGRSPASGGHRTRDRSEIASRAPRDPCLTNSAGLILEVQECPSDAPGTGGRDGPALRNPALVHCLKKLAGAQRYWSLDDGTGTSTSGPTSASMTVY